MRHDFAPVAALALVTALAAQESSRQATAAAFDLDAPLDQPVIGHVDGAWWSAGTHYMARFAADGMTFRPQGDGVGESAVRFAFESARRIGGEVWPAARVDPAVDREVRVASYDRGAFVERYDLRTRDVEQSFVFDRLPRGEGDLVVRLRTESDLPCTAVGRADDGFAWSCAAGEVTVGRVVGIDANGERTDGWIRVEPGAVELGLPREFVERAALPLTLDPLIGSTFQVIGGSNQYPDVAYDVSTQTYLVAYLVIGNPHSIRARRVTVEGVPTGASMFISTSDGTGPRVANINDRDSFIVVFREGNHIKARRAFPSGGVGATTLTVSTNFRQFSSSFDVGGDATTTDNDAIVVWQDRNADVRAAQIEDSPSRGFHVFGEKVLRAAEGAYLRIANSGGKAGRYLVTWTEGPLSTSGPDVIRGLVIDRNLTVLDPLVQITTSGDSFSPSVDGDGLQWVVSYDTCCAQRDVFCRSVQFDPANPSGTSVGPQRVIEADAGDHERGPSVAWLGDSALVAYVDANAHHDVYGKTVDPFTCSICETQFVIEERDGATTVGVACASTRSGGSNDERALVVWDRRDPGTQVGPIRGARFEAADGEITDLGGGCGNNGDSYATCARVGHTAFAFRLREAPPANVVLFLGTDRIDAPCGTCRLVPDPASSVMVVRSTDSAGRVEVAVPIPGQARLQGIVLYSQWFLFTNAGGCSSLPGDFSNAFQIEIQ